MDSQIELRVWENKQLVIPQVENILIDLSLQFVMLES